MVDKIKLLADFPDDGSEWTKEKTGEMQAAAAAAHQYKEFKGLYGKKYADGWWSKQMDNWGMPSESFEDFQSRVWRPVESFVAGGTLKFSDEISGALNTLHKAVGSTPEAANLAAPPAEEIRSRQMLSEVSSPMGSAVFEVIGNLITALGLSAATPAKFGALAPTKHVAQGGMPSLMGKVAGHGVQGSVEGAAFGGAEAIGAGTGTLMDRIQDPSVSEGAKTGFTFGAGAGAASPVATTLGRQAFKGIRSVTGKTGGDVADVLFEVEGQAPKVSRPVKGSTPLEQGSPGLTGILAAASKKASNQADIIKNLTKRAEDIVMRNQSERNRLWGSWKHTNNQGTKGVLQAPMKIGNKTIFQLEENWDLVKKVSETMPRSARKEFSAKMQTLTHHRKTGMPLPKKFEITRETMEEFRSGLSQVAQSDDKLAGRAGRFAGDLVDSFSGADRSSWKRVIADDQRLMNNFDEQARMIMEAGEIVKAGAKERGSSIAETVGGQFDPIQQVFYRAGYIPRQSIAALYMSRAPKGTISRPTANNLMEMLTEMGGDVGPTIEKGRERAARRAQFTQAMSTFGREGSLEANPVDTVKKTPGALIDLIMGAMP